MFMLCVNRDLAKVQMVKDNLEITDLMAEKCTSFKKYLVKRPNLDTNSTNIVKSKVPKATPQSKVQSKVPNATPQSKVQSKVPNATPQSGGDIIRLPINY